MLSYMRRNAGSWLIKAMLVGVALSFVIGFGILPTLREGDPGFVVAEVGDRRITRGQWEAAYENMRRFYQQIYNDQLTQERIKQMRLRETALDNLITRALEQQEAARLGLQVSDDELQGRIRSLPYFQRNGLFDRDIYLRVLSRNQLTPDAFENDQREQMLLERLHQFVRGAVKVSELELWRNYLLEQEKVNLQFLVFDPTAYRDKVTVEEESVRKFFKENEDLFRTSERVEISYARFSHEAYLHRVEVRPEDIEEYYELHLDEFSHPEEVRLRHILLKLEPGFKEEVFEEKKRALQEILEKVRKGEDFAALARAHSEDATAIRGGDLGYVKRGELVPEVESAAFALKPGEVSDIVSSPFGLHILKAEDVRAARQDALDEVKERIREGIAREKARQLARRKAEEFLWETKESGKMEGILLDGEAVPVASSGLLGPDDPLPDVGREPAVLQAAFGLQKGERSAVVKGDRGFYVLEVRERRGPEIPAFEAVREQVEAKYRDSASRDLAKEAAEQALEKLRGGEVLEQIAASFGKAVQETGFFSRLSGVVPRMGKSDEVAAKVFSLSEKDPVPDRVFEVNQKFYVFRLKDHMIPAREEMLAKKESLLEEYRKSKEEAVYRDWLSALRERSHVKVKAL